MRATLVTSRDGSARTTIRWLTITHSAGPPRADNLVNPYLILWRSPPSEISHG